MQIERWFAEKEDIEGYGEDDPEYVTVEDFDVIRETARAVLIETFDGGQVWVPCSVIKGGRRGY